MANRFKDIIIKRFPEVADALLKWKNLNTILKCKNKTGLQYELEKTEKCTIDVPEIYRTCILHLQNNLNLEEYILEEIQKLLENIVKKRLN